MPSNPSRRPVSKTAASATKRGGSRLLGRLRRGQAMVEYSMITHVILMGGLVAAAAPVIPGAEDGNFISITGLLMTALGDYYASIFAVLCSSTI